MHRQWLLDQVAETSGLTPAELRERLLAQHALSAGINAIWLFFRREGISFKKMYGPPPSGKREMLLAAQSA